MNDTVVFPSLPIAVWDDNPQIRLKECASLEASLRKNYIDAMIAQCPKPNKYWPFGMPTSINPYVLFIGISPGGGSHNTDSYYDSPTVGIPHSGFGGPYANPNHDWKRRDDKHWGKVRELAKVFWSYLDPILKEGDGVALTGQLNMGTANNGTGNIEATDLEIIKWIPKAIQMLKPRIVVAFGLKSLSQNPIIKDAWKNTILEPLTQNEKDLKKELFNWPKSKKKYYFAKAPSENYLMIHWPNHPSRPPFGSAEALKAAARQFSELYLKKA